MPFAFQDREGRLVGLDVEMARVLATDLDVDVQFFQTDLTQLPRLLAEGVGDIAMSGFVVTPDRAADTLMSSPYLDETMAFVTRDQLRDRFRTWDAVRQLGASASACRTFRRSAARSRRGPPSCKSSRCENRRSS